MNTALLDKIRSTIADTAGDDFPEQATKLLGILGYRSERTLPDQSGAVDEFLARFPPNNPDTKSEQSFRDAAAAIHVLFQVTDEEIGEGSGNLRLFRDDKFDESNVKSFLFTAVELIGDDYPRGRYAAFTRVVNKCFPNIPSVVLFRTATGRITLAFVHVRPNKRNPERNVIGKVSLIREIDPVKPHRAHLEILAELSLEDRLRWVRSHNEDPNFDGLLKAWLYSLNTEELNRRFYRQMNDWFERAVKQAKFPAPNDRVPTAESQVIRLITRMLFIWFIKEKGLVDENLFIEEQVSPLLEDYNPEEGDSYYRAVLQNLFFATLNTEIGRRGFSRGDNSTHRDFSRYRYRKEMADPDRLLGLFDKTPFINGGLFDCLDTFEGTRRGGVRIDCFSDVHYRPLSIPNRLFFDQDDKNPGLITLFERYKFTVEENTPAEVEVALDPELLGKVFENLLAANTDETKKVARKQTGSYYTPRQVVDYMVDESLVEALAGKVNPKGKDSGWWRERLLYLLDYNDAFDDATELFTKGERQLLVLAISNLRVLDPAVGSGAFPMSVLHKLTLALRRLDPENEEWKKLQIEQATQRAGKAFGMASRHDREQALADISATFQRYRESDFGRKLYLVQNCIFGVDIQPIATQLAKLRFFISLAIEQDRDPGAPNYGIRPLPNLETRFVAANTLLGLEQTDELLWRTEQTEGLVEDIRNNREMYFHATTRQEKLDRQKDDRKLRGELADVLQENGFGSGDAKKLAQWDPFDQNASADWFSAEYTFGIEQGFDIVIGNPPYIHLRRLRAHLRQAYASARFETFSSMGDIYQLFYERGSLLLVPESGVLSYITSNSWLKGAYGKTTRGYLLDKHTPLRLLEVGKDVFENTVVDTAILISRVGKTDILGKAVDMDRLPDKDFPPPDNLWGELRPKGHAPWSVLPSADQPIMDKIESRGTPLREWNVAIHVGIVTGFNEAFVINNTTKQLLVSAEPKSAEVIKPVLRGRDIRRYRPQWADWWVIDMHNGYGNVPAVNVEDYRALRNHFDAFYPQLEERRDQGQTPYNLRDCAFHEDYTKEKLVWIELVENGRFAYDDSGMYCLNTTFFMTGDALKYLCAVLNSRIITWFVRSTALNSGMGTPRWIRSSVERLPIPQISSADQRPFVRLVDRILRAKDSDPDADTSDLEAEIDRLVYGLYGLTDEEIAAVEGRAG